MRARLPFEATLREKKQLAFRKKGFKDREKLVHLKKCNLLSGDNTLAFYFKLNFFTFTPSKEILDQE